MQQQLIYSANIDTNLWQTADDRVMGGVSVARISPGKHEDQACHCLSGEVSLENRGGFIQMKWPFEPSFNASAFEGIFIRVWGNNEVYNVHLRTSQLWLPWQSFRSSFVAKPQWQTLYLPFSSFENYKTPVSLDPTAIKKLAIVAIGKVFYADVCISEMGFYSDNKPKNSLID